MSECKLCDAGSEIIDGWHYTRVGGMVFPLNKRCTKLHPPKPRPESISVFLLCSMQCGQCGSAMDWVSTGQRPLPGTETWPARCNECDLTVRVPLVEATECVVIDDIQPQ